MCITASMMHSAPMNGQTYKKKTNPARKNVKSYIKTLRRPGDPPLEDPPLTPPQGRGIISCRVRTYVSALFVIVTVPVIAVGAGSARPILYVRRGRPSCLPLFVYLNVGTRRALSEEFRPQISQIIKDFNLCESVQSVVCINK